MADERFIRTRLLFGNEAMHRLENAFVVVVGLGAVGSYAVEGLARTGVGRLRVVDFDVVRPSNLNRQLLALEATLGRGKAELAAERVAGINPACRVEVARTFVDRQTAPAVLAGVPGVVVDAIDSVGPKVELLAAAVAAGLPVVSSMGAACRTDPLRIRVDDLSATRGCPLARLVRKRLRRRGVSGGVRCVYSTEPVDLHLEAGAVPPDEAPDVLARGRARRPLPSFACITGMFGLAAAREAVFILLGRATAQEPVR